MSSRTAISLVVAASLAATMVYVFTRSSTSSASDTSSTSDTSSASDTSSTSEEKSRVDVVKTNVESGPAKASRGGERPTLASQKPVYDAPGKKADWDAFSAKVSSMFPEEAKAILGAHTDACAEFHLLKDEENDDATLTDDDLMEAFLAVSQKRNDALAKAVSESVFDKAAAELAWPFIVTCFGEEESQKIKANLKALAEDTGIELPGVPD